MITLEINDSEAIAMFRRLDFALTDQTELTPQLGEMLVQSTQDRIKRGEQPDGAAFVPRSPVTLEHYAKQGFSFGAPLNQSGDMRNTIYHDSGSDYVRVGSNAIQAAVMHFGATAGAFGAHIGKDSLGRDHIHSIPWGNIPARPFIGLSDEDQTNIAAEIEEWLEDAAALGD
jgi:phage virion morphogenesis protein